MDRPTLLDRRPLGIPNYLVFALLAVLVVALIPRGARRALETNTNKVEDWLPASYAESVDLSWFRDQFGNEAFVVASWDGCTLGSPERLTLLAEKLADEPLDGEIARAAQVSPHSDRRLFSRVVTGTDMIDQLVAAPTRLPREDAIARLEGAFVGPPTVAGDDDSRTTCLVAYLSSEAMATNRTMRLAIDRLVEIAKQDCGIDGSKLHIGGPPVDNVAIDVEGEKTLKTLAGLSGLVGLVLAYVCFRSWRLTGMVLVVATLAAGASLAMVFYFGAFEVLVWGVPSPRLGKLDAVLMSMPAVVYVLALSGAIHFVNYYRDAVHADGRRGAVERAARMALVPCGLAALTTAIGLASLSTSDILPIEKFGVFSAIGVMGAVALLFTILPVALHRFAPPPVPRAASASSGMPGWARSIAERICRHHAWVSFGAVAMMVLFALGLPRMESSVKLIKLLHPEADLVQDYAWLESQLGNLVPMEVVVAVPSELRRGVNDHPEASGKCYAMTTYERLTLARRISEQLEQLEPVSRVLNASTFAPDAPDSRSPSNRRTREYIVSEAVDKNRSELREFLRWERPDGIDDAQAPRELWRASARIAALEDIDYGQFVGQLRETVEPILETYRARDQLVEELASQGKSLAGARISLIVPDDFDSTDALFATLLREAGVTTVTDGRRGSLWTVPVGELESLTDEQQLKLEGDDAVVTLDAGVAQQLRQQDISCTLLKPSETLSDSSIQAVYTGVVPLVYKTQRQLLVSLQQSLVVASALIAIVLIVLLRSMGGGLATMIPNLFPLVVVFGGLGWLGIPIDIGIMMTASVALGVAVDDTIHFVSWFRRGLSQGLTRYEAALESYERCALAMVQTTIIAGLGLAVFALSTFTPTQQFGYLMVTILTAALVGDLILLPALLVGPVGSLFPASARRFSDDLDAAQPGKSDPQLPTPTASEDQSNFAGAAELVVSETAQQAVEPREERLLTQDEAHETLSPANAVLHARLRAFRRDSQQQR